MHGSVTSDKLRSIKKVFYHGSCADGITSREMMKQILYAVQSPQWKRLVPLNGEVHLPTNIEFVPYYFEDLKTVPENALFVDCSPKGVDQCRAVLSAGGVIIDHHETFRPSFEMLRETYPNQLIFGDTEVGESGARLCYYLGESLAITEELYHWKDLWDEVSSFIAASDCWMKDSRPLEFHRGRLLAGFITFFGNSFAFGDPSDLDWGLIQMFGDARMREQRTLAAGALRRSRVMLSGKIVKIALINALNISDAAEILRSSEGANLTVAWKIQQKAGEEQCIFSLRGDDHCPALPVAEALGGGGHRLAAGASVPLWKVEGGPMNFILNLLESL